MTDLMGNCIQNNCDGGCERKCCIDWVLAIFAIIFSLALGLTLGVALAERISVATASLITATVILGIPVIVTAIYKKCIKNC